MTTNTTVPAGTGNQAFCYDDLNRLTWGGSAGGTVPTCAGTIATGTLTATQYRQSYGYDTLDRLTQGPSGSGYTYGDTNHLDAVTRAPSYSTTYGAAGSQVVRNGQALTYDMVRRLTHWQNTASSPTSTADYAYNGSGERVQQITATVYIGGYEEATTSVQTGTCSPSCTTATTTTK